MKKVLMTETHKQITTLLHNYSSEQVVPVEVLSSLYETIKQEEEAILSTNEIAFKIVAKAITDGVETHVEILDKAFTTTELNDIQILQPLDTLTVEELEDLAQHLGKLSTNKNIIIMPCMVKALEVIGIVRNPDMLTIDHEDKNKINITES